MKVTIDKKKCIGCGACEAICSEVFHMNSDGKAEAESETTLKCAKEAADSCPVQAISVK